MLLLIILSVLVLPLLGLLLVVNLLAVGVSGLGFSGFGGILIVLAVMLGSFINIPLSKGDVVRVRDRRFFGLLRTKTPVSGGLSINLGGAVIPLFITSILIPNTPLYPVLITTVLATLSAYKSSRIIPSIGVVMSPLITVFLVTFSALILAPENPEAVAFISGVWGSLIGADFLNLNRVMRRSGSVMIIGGGGVFDGILLIGILSSILAGI